MGYSIEFQEIPILSYLSRSTRVRLTDLFKRLELKKGSVLIEYQKAVPGIFVVVDGVVEVVVERFEKKSVINEIRRGGIFGEMSLLDGTGVASAEIRVASESAKILFCDKDDFKDLVFHDPSEAYAFYKGAALLLDGRLRETNDRLIEQINGVHDAIIDILGKSVISDYLEETRASVEDTGCAIVSRLSKALSGLEAITEHYPELAGGIRDASTEIEEVFLVEAQKVDRIAQQLSIIWQHFENIKRIAMGGESQEIRGDKNLFEGRKVANLGS